MADRVAGRRQGLQDEGWTADDDIAARGIAAHVGTHAEARLRCGSQKPADAFCPRPVSTPLLPFRIDPLNGRKALDISLRLL
jgi:hypothetical protein